MIADFLRRASGLYGSKGASFPRTCNVCGYTGRFAAAGRPRRIDARCPKCGSAERYRLLTLWLDKHGAELRSARLLHFAPERGLTSLLKTRVRDYRSADISPGRADLVLRERKSYSFSNRREVLRELMSGGSRPPRGQPWMGPMGPIGLIERRR